MSNVIEIWQPRYYDNKVLIATFKVKSGKNLVRFTKAKHLAGKTFSFQCEDVLNCPVQPNGKITVYVVPMELLVLEDEDGND